MKLKINEIFKGIQGEGFNTGLEVVFVRLSGCNMKCSFCDTDHDNGIEMTTNEIINKIELLECKNLIFTGGEPTLQNINSLLLKLKERDYWLSVESNGTGRAETYELFDYVAISPKSNPEKLHKGLVSEVRVVNHNLNQQKLSKVKSCINAEKYYISPKEENGDFNLRESLELISKLKKEEKSWKISLQLHKLAEIK